MKINAGLTKVREKITYCTVTLNLDKILEIFTFEKSQKFGKFEKKINPVSEKNGCDA